MADEGTVSVGGSGAISQTVSTKEIVTGAGMWVSVTDPKHGNVWKPALVPQTIQMTNPDPKSIHRVVDVIVRDPNTNKPLLRPDPSC